MWEWVSRSFPTGLAPPADGSSAGHAAATESERSKQSCLRSRLGRAGSARASPAVRPLPPDQLPVPAKERLGRHHERRPPVSGKRPTRGGEERPVPVAKVRTRDRAAEHPHLVPEDCVLELELRHAPSSCHYPDETDKHEVEEGSQGAISRCCGCEVSERRRRTLHAS